MSVNYSTTGFPQNNGLQFNAIDYKTNIATVLENDDYSGGAAVNAYRLPVGTVIMEFGPLPESELSGMYVIRTFWSGSNLGEIELIGKIYDGVAATPIYTINIDYNAMSMNVGNSSVVIFDPRYEYTFKIEVGYASSNIMLDYIQLDQLYHGGSVDQTQYAYDKGDGTPVAAIPVTEGGMLAVKGSGGRGGQATLTFDTDFCTTPLVELTSMNEYLLPAVTARNTNTATVVMNHIDGINWSNTQYVLWTAKGFVEPPFTPVDTNLEPYI